MNSKIIICLFSALVCFAASLDAGKSTHTLTYGDRTSDIVIHVPENYDGEGDLLLALHGYGGQVDADNCICNWGNIGGLADKYGLIGVCADGNGAGGDPEENSWNAAGCCGKAVEQNIDDIGYLKYVIEWVKDQVDVNKVYATGFSNGAELSYRIAAEANDVFDGVAPQAGFWFGSPPTFKVSTDIDIPWGFTTNEISDCTADYPEGTEGDCWTTATYDYSGLPQGFSTLLTIGTVDDVEGFEQPVAAHRFLAETVIGCSDETDVYSKGKAKCTEWQTCPNDERIALCIIDGMDHDISTEATYGFEGVETAYLYLKGGFPSDELNGKNLIWLPYGFLFILYLLIV